jgi:hypothetical protein
MRNFSTFRPVPLRPPCPSSPPPISERRRFSHVYEICRGLGVGPGKKKWSGTAAAPKQGGTMMSKPDTKIFFDLTCPSFERIDCKRGRLLNKLKAESGLDCVAERIYCKRQRAAGGAGLPIIHHLVTCGRAAPKLQRRSVRWGQFRDRDNKAKFRDAAKDDPCREWPPAN